MKRYIVIDTDCESDVWFDNSENKILHYEEIEEILEKQDTKWQKLKEWLKKYIEYQEALKVKNAKVIGAYMKGNIIDPIRILDKMQELDKG